MNQKIVYKNIQILPTVFFILIFVVSVPFPVINKISLYLLIPILFLYSFIKNPRLVIQFKPLLIFLFYIIWSLITFIASTDLEKSINELIIISSVFVLSYIVVYFSIYRRKYIYLFYLLYVLRYFVLLYKGYTLGFTSIETESERFNVSDINANMFGYYGYFAIISSFFLLNFSFKKFEFNKQNKIYLLLFVLVSFGALIGVYYSASRGGVLIILFTLTLFLIYRYLYPFSRRALISIIVITVILAFILPKGLEYYSGSYLEYRFNSVIELEEETRVQLLIRAVEIGTKESFFGVGPGNFLLYTHTGNNSHSTFFEILANNGVTGLFIFMYLMFYYAKTNRKILKLDNIQDKKTAYFFFIFFITYIIYNFLYIFHTSLFLMTFYFLVSIHMELFKRSRLLSV